jgi:integrase
VLARLENDRRLDAKLAATFAGAIRTICAVLQRPPQTIPASMGDIDKLLRDVPASSHGRSRKTLANTRSRLKAALLHVSDTPKLPPPGTPLSPAWNALYQRLTDLRLRNGLSRLVRTASARDVEPKDIDDCFLQELLRTVAAVNWGRDTLPYWRRTAALWNEAVASVPGWPQQQLASPPETTEARHLTLDELPASYCQDLESYLVWAQGNDPLADNGPATPLKASTLRLRREQLRLAASALAASLGGADKVKDLSTLVEPPNARAILNWYLRRAGGKPTAFIRAIATTLLSVARHWARVEDPKELRELIRRLGSAPAGLTAKNADLLRRLDDPAVLAALLELPQRIRARLRTRRFSPARRLQQVQVALAIDLLLVAPMRLQNLSELRLNRSIQWPTGRGGPVYLVLLREETKNALPLEYAVPERLHPVLHDYLDRYRPQLAEKDGDWLFLRLDGKRVPDSALRDGITKAVARELGIKLTPHQFRHVAAKIALDAHPGALAMVGDLLGHSNIKTTRHFYAGMRVREAAREYDRLLDRYRATSRQGS